LETIIKIDFRQNRSPRNEFIHRMKSSEIRGETKKKDYRESREDSKEKGKTEKEKDGGIKPIKHSENEDKNRQRVPSSGAV